MSVVKSFQTVTLGWVAVKRLLSLNFNFIFIVVVTSGNVCIVRWFRSWSLSRLVLMFLLTLLSQEDNLNLHIQNKG